MNRYWLLAVAVLLCSCASESKTETDSSSSRTNDWSNVEPVAGLSVSEMESAAQTAYDELDVEFKERMAALKQTIQNAD